MENKVINALGQHVEHEKVKVLMAAIPEKPIIDDKPILHNESDTIAYTFHNSGILLGFNLSYILEYVRFYLVSNQYGYKACTLDVLPSISKETTKTEILDRFGFPNDQRSNKKLSKEVQLAVLLILGGGDWLLYDKGTYCLRFEFNDETNKLEEISFMLKGTVPGYDLEE